MKRTNKITAVVLTKNEEEHIASCLESVSFCDEILVIDDYSIDKTAAIAKKHGARVYARHLSNDFASQRNFALQKAQNVWVLFVDADEVVSTALAKEIVKAVNKPKLAGYYLIRSDNFLGQQMRGSEFGASKILRLGRKDAGHWQRPIHEVWEITGTVGTLHSPLLHTSHESIEQILNQISFHARLHSKQRALELGQTSFIRVFLFPVGKFLYNFILTSGYKDGTHGFVAHVLICFHSFLSWSSIWLKQHSEE